MKLGKLSIPNLSLVTSSSTKTLTPNLKLDLNPIKPVKPPKNLRMSSSVTSGVTNATTEGVKVEGGLKLSYSECLEDFLKLAQEVDKAELDKVSEEFLAEMNKEAVLGAISKVPSILKGLSGTKKSILTGATIGGTTSAINAPEGKGMQNFVGGAITGGAMGPLAKGLLKKPKAPTTIKTTGRVVDSDAVYGSPALEPLLLSGKTAYITALAEFEKLSQELSKEDLNKLSDQILSEIKKEG